MKTYLQKFKAIFRSPAFRSILEWSRCVRGSLALICVLGITITLLSLALTLVTRSLIDGATSRNVSALWMFGALLVAIIVVERLLGMWSSYTRTRSSARLQREMQGKVTEAIMGKEYPALKGFHSGELVSRVFSDVGVVKNGIMNLLPSLLTTLVSFVGAAAILISMDWRFVPLLIIAGVVGTAITLAFRGPMKRRHKRMQEAEAKLHAGTQETLENIRVVKASVSEERALSDLEGQRENPVNEQLRNGRLSILMNNGLGSMFDLS